MSESDIELQCEEIARYYGGVFWKWTSPGRRGVQDRILILPHCPAAFVEMKAPGGRSSRIQTHRRNQLRERGQAAWTVSNAHDFEERLLSYQAYHAGIRETLAKVTGPAVESRKRVDPSKEKRNGKAQARRPSRRSTGGR